MTAARSGVLLVCLCLAQSAAADRLVTVKGTEIRGLVELEVLIVEGEEAQIELPRASILEIRPSAGRLAVGLVDGTWIEGEAVSPNIAIRTDLYSQRFDWQDVRLVELDLDAEGSAVSSAFVRVDEVTQNSGRIERPSPLRLEIDIADVRDLKAEKGAGWTSSRLRLFYCDGVSIPVLQIQRSVSKNHYVTLTIEVSVRVQLSYDRIVHLGLQLLADPDVDRQYKSSFEVEEGHIRRVEFFMRFAQQEFDRIFSPEAKPRLRFSLTSEEA